MPTEKLHDVKIKGSETEGTHIYIDGHKLRGVTAFGLGKKMDEPTKLWVCMNVESVNNEDD